LRTRDAVTGSGGGQAASEFVVGPGGPEAPDVANGPEAGGAAGGDSSPGGRDVAGLFRERYAELVRLAALVVGDRATAEDVVQDVFARLCTRDRSRAAALSVPLQPADGRVADETW